MIVDGVIQSTQVLLFQDIKVLNQGLSLDSWPLGFTSRSGCCHMRNQSGYAQLLPCIALPIRSIACSGDDVVVG